MSTPTKRKPSTRSRRSTPKTSSPAAGKRGRADATVFKPLRPFTVDHFRAYGRNLILDTGRPWEVEDFQVAVVEDLFAGVPEVWMVVPEGNGKTTLMGGVALYYGDYTPSASVLLGAASRDQCGLLLGQAAGFVDRTPGLHTRFRVFPGYRRIRCLRSNGQIQVYAADDRTGDGVIPGGIVLLDELHRHRDMRLYRTWRGKLEKRGAQLAAISTAGEPDTEFEDIRAQVKLDAADLTVDGCYTRAATPEMVLHDYAVPAGGDLEDIGLVEEANPFSGVTREKLARKRKSPTMSPTHWRRFVCNQATRVEEFWIAPDAFDACKGEPRIDPDWDAVVGVDIGQKKDSTAVVAVGLDGAGRVHVEHHILVPQPGRPIAVTDARGQVGDIDDRLRLLEVAYDPYKFAESAELLEERGLLMVEFPQTDARMAPASEALYELIMDGRLVHDGDPEFRRQILAAVPGMTERGVRISKRKSKERIDAAVALAMAVHRLLDNNQGGDGPMFEVIA